MKIYNSTKDKDIICVAEFYKGGSLQIIYPFFKREIPDSNGMFDISTVYGYSGPLIKSLSSHIEKTDADSLIKEFDKSFSEYCLQNNIVSEFVRFHPLEKNVNYFSNSYDINYVRDTVKMNLSDEETIWGNVHSKKRNMIRKAKKNGVKIEFIDNPSIEDIEDFYNIYIDTMKKQNAPESYYFNISFFYNTFKYLEENVILVNAYLDESIVSSSIVMLSYPSGHYHFSGTLSKGLKVAANDLLLYETSLFLLQNGFKFFHLGGGYESNSDPLFKFKIRFAKDGTIPFYIGKKIHIPDVYKELTYKKGNDLTTNFFPAYRK
ncbi:hypothetical protein GCM10010954_21900 [Halobacillus andaensis]|uniref:Lipid II:glycine glycyltransferase n=1 Tax=Halobacillus andaensis TaxID=1176239 RepID=A0A917B4C9_HALAA|nr:GNAT family N-acetyltransferase [Halobacillus andaensis]MBP2004301.1 lipid II:glycine glycyltransferase (peptidoglycan interpeptide bridge formation enzyme) [Halobacillus andaensis]GGF22691.1 hypothetical protein GCM10010954_21900 [Halobacillus andaensis]